MTLHQAALTALLHRYLAGFMDPWVSPDIALALCWCLQAAGEPLPLHFVASPHGPQAPTIGDLLSPIAVPAEFLTNQGKSPASGETPLTLRPGSHEPARAILARHPETAARVERVGALIEGFESPAGLELLVRAHWSATQEAASRDEAFPEHQVLLALSHLHTQGWLGEARHDH